MISLFPINMITDRPQGRDDLHTQRKETGREREGKREGEKISQKAPSAWNVFLLVKMLLSWFLLWLEVLELFSIRKAFLFVIKDWKWKYFCAKITNRHNNVMQFFSPHYLHTVIQPIRSCPAALLRTCFTIGGFSYSLFCNLEDIIPWPALFINNCGSPINYLKSTYSWWQTAENTEGKFAAALLCYLFTEIKCKKKMLQSCVSKLLLDIISWYRGLLCYRTNQYWFLYRHNLMPNIKENNGWN